MKNLKNMAGQKRKGSMTVEATLLAPALLLVSFGVLLVTYYMYGTVRYTAACGEAVIAASTEGVRSDGDAEGILEDAVEEITDEYHLPLKSFSADSSAENAKVSMEISIESISLLGIGGWERDISEETTIVKPVSVIRGVQTGEEWLTKIKEIWKE